MLRAREPAAAEAPLDAAGVVVRGDQEDAGGRDRQLLDRRARTRNAALAQDCKRVGDGGRVVQGGSGFHDPPYRRKEPETEARLERILAIGCGPGPAISWPSACPRRPS